ncbi:3-hydroxyacyl-CoA dehydrogenase [Arenibaculum pallidiluteum]|uniref:3-hydroxyacyl-CoA dehydrogenase n=1 Tax=Arenibaculum pallidiluteum TaxID=2812559 RepID=UPI001A975E57|nr:3-hydroxyacyl-CoA dehydrogenase [Arenibaculum pallidiluteum]
MTTRVGIIGSGLIGRAWAIVFARGGCEVRLADASPAEATKALDIIRSSLGDLEGAGLLKEGAGAILARLSVAEDMAEAVAGADYVQENLPERLDLKRAAFAGLDRLAPEGAVIASSTSAIPGSAFTEGLAGRGRCLVAHPVNPPHLIPLVELCRTPWTSDDAVARTRALMEQVGQVPVTVEREIEGFVLNRLQGALLNEALRLVAHGYVSPEDLDRCVRDGLGLRWSFMGPFETIDLNAPEGVADYAARYGGFYDRVEAEPLPPAGWTHPVVARIHAERRKALPAEGLPARQAWRDRRLMALLAHKIAASSGS